MRRKHTLGCEENTVYTAHQTVETCKLIPPILVMSGLGLHVEIENVVQGL